MEKAKLEEALKAAETWWRGKDPSSELFICDTCAAQIEQTEGTSLLGGYMRCARCTEKMADPLWRVREISSSNPHIFLHPDIPRKRLRAALKKIAPGVAADEVQILVATSHKRSGKVGLVFTATHLFGRDALSKPVSVLRHSIVNVSFVEDSDGSPQLMINGRAFAHLYACEPAAVESLLKRLS